MCFIFIYFLPCFKICSIKVKAFFFKVTSIKKFVIKKLEKSIFSSFTHNIAESNHKQC